MSYEHLKSGNTVNFNTQTSILKTEYRAVKVLGVVTADLASTVKDVKSLHLQIKPYIPGLPNLYSDYSYVIIQHSNGAKEALGLPWILQSSISLSTKKDYQLILDGLEPEQVELVRQMLVNRGIDIRSFTELT